MSTRQRAYGRGALVYTSLLDAEDSPAGLVLETGMTFAAADVKVVSDEQAATNAAAESVAFTSGSEKPLAGQTLTGATSAATATVVGVVLTSGTWAGADAAGYLFVQDAGTLQSENLNNTTTGTSNVMTIGSDLDGFAARVVSKSVVIALTSDELTCRQCSVEIADATATEVWLETTIAIETYGHPSALHQPDGNGLVLADGIVGATGNDTTHVHAEDLGLGNDEVNEHLFGIYDDNTGEWHYRYIDDYVLSTELVTLDANAAALPFTPTSGDRWQVLTIRRDTKPAALGSQAETDVVDSVNSSDVSTILTDTAEIANLFGTVVQDSINDASATATGFTVTTSVGSDTRVGFLRLTSGTLEGESRLVSWQGTTVSVLSDSSMPTALKQFSAAPADSVTFDFRPL